MLVKQMTEYVSLTVWLAIAYIASLFCVQIFSFSSLDFFPIDDQLFGNEGRDHNYFFTYEVHTYIDITQAGGEVFQFQVQCTSVLLNDGS